MSVFEFKHRDRILAEHQHPSRIAFENRSVEDGIGLRDELGCLEGKRGSALRVDCRIGARRGNHGNAGVIRPLLDFRDPDVVLQALRKRYLHGSRSLIWLENAYTGISQESGQAPANPVRFGWRDRGTIGNLEGHNSGAGDGCDFLGQLRLWAAPVRSPQAQLAEKIAAVTGPG